MQEANERQQLLVNIARMYYFEKLSQQQIADALHMSRSNVSLLLKSCLENHVIEIKINDTVSRAHDVASQIKERYRLKNVLIAKTYNNAEQTVGSVARLVVHFLRGVVRSNMLLGYTNDAIMQSISEALYMPEYSKIHTIQMIGGLSPTFHGWDGQALAREFQTKFNGISYVLQAPLMVKSTKLKQTLLEEQIIKEVFGRFASIDIALMAIEKRVPLYGLPNPDYLSETDSLQLTELGAICHFCGHYLDREGNPCGASINDRVIAISLEELKRIPVTVGIAHGVYHSPAVLSCLRGGYVNTLIVDEALAKTLV